MAGAKLSLALLLPSAFVLSACGGEPVSTAFVEKEVTRQARARTDRGEPPGLRIVTKCARREGSDRTFACVVKTTVDVRSPLAADIKLRPVTVTATVAEDRETVVVEGLDDVEATVTKRDLF